MYAQGRSRRASERARSARSTVRSTRRRAEQLAPQDIGLILTTSDLLVAFEATIDVGLNS
jgi:hypothetical protein